MSAKGGEKFYFATIDAEITKRRMKNPNAIETLNLTRSFGKFTAVKNLSISVPNSSVYGFLDPNGAGKTTTIRMLLGLIRPDGGEVKLFDAALAGNQ